MLILAVVLIGAALILCTGGSLRSLADLELHRSGAVTAALTLQVLIVTLLPGGSQSLHAGLHLLSYGLAAWFAWANRRLFGMPLLALGGCMNLAAISANGGTMPASRAALETAGIHPAAGDFTNVNVLPHPHLSWLGDVLAVPGGWPLANTFSVGDLLIAVGTLLLIHRLSRAPRDTPVTVSPSIG